MSELYMSSAVVAGVTALAQVQPELLVLRHSAAVSSFTCPAQAGSLYGASGLDCLQQASTAMSNISLCSCVLQGKAWQEEGTVMLDFAQE